MNIYEVAYYGIDDVDNFTMLFSHENKYSAKEFQTILDEILLDSNLLIALSILKKDDSSENFEKDYLKTIKYTDNYKSSILISFSEEVSDILKERYNFKDYEVPIVAEAYASEGEDEEEWREYNY